MINRKLWSKPKKPLIGMEWINKLNDVRKYTPLYLVTLKSLSSIKIMTL